MCTSTSTPPPSHLAAPCRKRTCNLCFCTGATVQEAHATLVPGMGAGRAGQDCIAGGHHQSPLGAVEARYDTLCGCHRVHGMLYVMSQFRRLHRAKALLLQLNRRSCHFTWSRTRGERRSPQAPTPSSPSALLQSPESILSLIHISEPTRPY